MVKDKKYAKKVRCWACDTLHYKKWRSEDHHIFTKDREDVVPLCVVCHDLVDRMYLNDFDVFSEYTKIIEDLEELPRGRTKYLKLFLLKVFKSVIENDKATKNKG